MTNGQNPLGFTLSAEKKAALVALLARYNVMLIEDDVYSELYFGREKPLPAKFWDRRGDDAALQLVLKMSGTRLSYRLGGGRQTGAADPAAPADEYAFHQFADAVSPRWITCPPSAMTPTCAVYVVSWRSVNSRPRQALLRHLPPEVIVHHSDSGYFLWIELPEGADASALSVRALASHISIAPGKMFSTSDSWTSFFRFNTASGLGGTRRAGG